ncbi:MAG TPA: Ig-like domain-containing protein [Kofleriaceae bacterium]|jgi:cysteine-rich repeat protein
MKRFLPGLVLLAACGASALPTLPDLSDVTLTTAEDMPVTQTLPIDDPSSLMLSFGMPEHGTLTHDGATVTYTPAANFNGPDSFTVTADNGKHDSTSTIAITVTPVNDAPVPTSDSLAALRNTTLVVQTSALLTNDGDPDGDALSVTAVSTASMGTVALAGTTLTYTPPAGYSGTATFGYTVSDGTADATAMVTVSITGDNVAPVATNDTATTAEDTALVVNATTLLANDTDADQQTLSVTAVSNPIHGTVSLSGTTITFTPAANYNGAASFDYTTSDGLATDLGTVAVTVTPVNDAPVANDDVASTSRNHALALQASTLLANDSDVDSTISITAVSSPTHGTVALSGTTITFTPTTNYVGPATFVYTLSDGTLTDTALVTINIANGNVAPVAVDDAKTTAEDTVLTVTAASLSANDTDGDGDALVITAVANATHGTVSLASGSITFTPTTNYNGPASFEYTVSDGTATDTGLVSITITPVNDAPVAVDDTASTASNTAVSILAASLVTNDTDVDNDPLAVTAVGNATNGTVMLASGSITFTPTSGFSGTATFEYTVSDGALTDIGLVSVSVGPVCGNGVVEGAEQCDDHNTMDDDGCSHTCQNESLASFAFTGAAGNEATFNAEAVNPLLTSPVTFARGAGLTAQTAAGAFNSSGWSTASAIDLTDYVGFTLTPMTGDKMTMLSLAFDQQRSATGPAQWSVRSSLDNFTADIMTGTVPTSLATSTVSLGAAFANVTTPVTFRIYAWGASATGGTLRFDNVSVVGSAGP